MIDQSIIFVTKVNILSRPQPQSYDPPDAKAYIVLFSVTMLWGSAFFFTSIALRGYTPAQVVTARMLLGAIVLVPPIIATRQYRRLGRTDWLWLVSMGVVGYGLPFISIAWAQQYLSSSLAAIFMSLIPLFVLILSKLFLGDNISPRKWLGFLIGFVGLVLLVGPEGISGVGTEFLAQMALLLSCLFLAANSIILRRMPTIPPLQTTATALFIGGLLVAPFGLQGLMAKSAQLIAEHGGSVIGLLPLISVIFMGVVLSGIGQTIRTQTIMRRGPVFFSISGYGIPVCATGLGVTFLGDEITLQKIIAFCIILSGLILAQSRSGHKNP